MHTHYSDGADSPKRIVDRALAMGLAVVAITDHDTVAGVAEAEACARLRRIEFLAGTEISAEFQGAEVHVVGLGIRLDCPVLLAMLNALRERRRVRAEDILRQLDALGIRVASSDVFGPAASASIGRMRIARAIQAAGYTRTTQEAFDKYIGRGQPAFVDCPRVPCEDAIQAIHEAGGLAFLGHPGIGGIARLIPHLLTLPFDGIEAYHSKHSSGEIAAFERMAAQRGLLVAGGSDGHAASELGAVRVPYEYCRAVKQALVQSRA